MYASQFVPQHIKCNLWSLQSQTPSDYISLLLHTFWKTNVLRIFKFLKHLSQSFAWGNNHSLSGWRCNKCRSDDAVEFYVLALCFFFFLIHLLCAASVCVWSPGTSWHVCVVIAEGDDLKFDPFGTSALSTLASYDWSERDEGLQGELRKQQQGLDALPLPPLASAPRSEPAFDSGENISKAEDASSADDKFEAFADFGDKGGANGEDDFGDFASTFSEKSDSPAAVAADESQSEASDEFGAFQGDKPKFGKSDFLKASAQANVKSSEEMIKSELATFDLSVQGKWEGF